MATKITDTAVESLKRTINENYLDVAVGRVMTQANLLAADLTEDDPETAVKGVFYQARDLLAGCRATMDAFEAAGRGNSADFDAEQLAQTIKDINSNLPSGEQLQQTAAEIDRMVFTALEKVQRALDAIQQAAEDDSKLQEALKVIQDASAAMGQLGDQLTTWANRLEQQPLQRMAGGPRSCHRAAADEAAQCRGHGGSGISGVLPRHPLCVVSRTEEPSPA